MHEDVLNEVCTCIKSYTLYNILLFRKRRLRLPVVVAARDEDALASVLPLEHGRQQFGFGFLEQCWVGALRQAD